MPKFRFGVWVCGLVRLWQYGRDPAASGRETPPPETGFRPLPDGLSQREIIRWKADRANSGGQVFQAKIPERSVISFRYRRSRGGQLGIRRMPTVDGDGQPEEFAVTRCCRGNRPSLSPVPPEGSREIACVSHPPAEACLPTPLAIRISERAEQGYPNLTVPPVTTGTARSSRFSSSIQMSKRGLGVQE
jgi:hypothetical protein